MLQNIAMSLRHRELVAETRICSHISDNTRKHISYSIALLNHVFTQTDKNVIILFRLMSEHMSSSVR